MKRKIRSFLAWALVCTMLLGDHSVAIAAEAGTENVATEKATEVVVQTPETQAPETQAPETKAPETQAPETKAPETQAPETKAPETQAPETKAPETQAPETQAPETQAPETQAPETQAPETQAPETQAPETQAPETQAPETEAPETQATEAQQITESSTSAPATEAETAEKVTETEAAVTEVVTEKEETEIETEEETELTLSSKTFDVGVSSVKITDDGNGFAVSYDGKEYKKVSASGEIVLYGSSVNNTVDINTGKSVTIRLKGVTFATNSSAIRVNGNGRTDLVLEGKNTIRVNNGTAIEFGGDRDVYISEDAKTGSLTAISANGAAIAARHLTMDAPVLAEGSLGSADIVSSSNLYRAYIMGMGHLAAYGAEVSVEGNAYNSGTYKSVDGQLSFYVPAGHIEAAVNGVVYEGYVNGSGVELTEKEETEAEPIEDEEEEESTEEDVETVVEEMTEEAEESVAEEETEEITEEVTEVELPVVTFAAVDEYQQPIAGHETAAMPEFEEELVLNNAEDAPIAISKYQYVDARIGELVLAKLVKAEEGLSYVAANGQEIEITEDIEITLDYEYVNTKRVYNYVDGNIVVTAVLEKGDAVPDDAEFRVTKVTPGSSYNYDAYMQTLNNNALSMLERYNLTEEEMANARDLWAEAAAQGQSIELYDETNTLLYDIAFMVDKRDVAGNIIAGEKVEYEPEEGSVSIRINFRGNTLENELLPADTSTEDTSIGDLLVTHLPIPESVMESADSTAEANVSPSQIGLEEISSRANVSGNGTLAFATDSLSVFSVNPFYNNPSNFAQDPYGGYYNAWTGSNDITIGQILAGLGDANGYSVYAENLTTTNHIEGNIAADNLYTTGAENLNVYYFARSNNLTSLKITKNVVGGSDGTFTFKAFDKDNKAFKEFSITTTNGTGSVTYKMSENPDWEAALDKGSVYVYEQSSAGGNLKDGSTDPNTGLKVTYQFDNGQGSTLNGNQVASTNQSHYIGNVYLVDDAVNNSNNYNDILRHILPNGTYSSELAYFGGYTELGEPYEAEFVVYNGKKCIKITVKNGTWYVPVDAAHNSEDSTVDQVIKSAEDGRVAGQLNGAMSAFSTQLANSKSTLAGPNQIIYVMNLDSSKGEYTYDWQAGGWVDKQTLSSNLAGSAGLYYVNAGNGFLSQFGWDHRDQTITTDYGNRDYLIINIDATGKSEYHLDQVLVNGQTNTNFANYADSHIIYNVVQKTESGAYVPYTGKILTDTQFPGVIFAPQATLKLGAVFAGQIVAKTVIRHGTSEIHKVNVTDQVDHDAELIVTNKGRSTTANIKAQKNLTGRSWKNTDSFEFKLTPGTGTETYVSGQNQQTGEDIESTRNVTSPMPKDANGNAQSTVTVQATSADAVSFGSIEYKFKGTYTYYVEEVIPSDADNVNGKKVKNGITYDTAKKTVTVTVTENASGDLVPTVTYPNGASAAIASNTYDAKGENTASGTKQIRGRNFKSGDEWSFTITPTNGGPLPYINGTQTNTARINPTSGTSVTVDYGTFKFTLADLGGQTSKTFDYTVTESGTVAGVANDTVSRSIAFTVSDNGDGTLNVLNSTGSGATPFVNTYDAKGEKALTGTKTITGREFKSGDEWTFNIEAVDGAPLPYKTVDGEEKQVNSVTINPTSGSSATIDLGTFKYVLADLGGETSKTFVYNVTESGTIAGVTNDPDTSDTIKITVSDNGDGTLAVELAADSEAVAFGNTYDALGCGEVGIKKTLVGRTFQRGDAWTFKITPVDGAPLPSDDDGNEQGERTIYLSSGSSEDSILGFFYYRLSDLGGADTKTFTYTITEDPSVTVTGVTNDPDTDRVLKVTVTDLKNGILDVQIADDSEPIEYTNTYNAEGEIALTGKKSITGRTFKSGDSWEFTIHTVDGGRLPVDANGNEIQNLIINPTTGSDYVLNFGTFKYVLADLGGADEKTFTYAITESGNIDGVTNDKNVSRTIKITVSDKDKDGVLDCTFADGSQAAEWTNTYDAAGEIPLTGTKKIVGRDFQENDEWTFAISGSPLPVDADGNTIESVTINPTSGKSATIDFGTFKYKLSDLGGKDSETFEYTITESGTVGGVTNDENASRTIKILVSDEDKDGELDCTLVDDSDDAEWTNTYNAEGEITFGGTKTLDGRDFVEGDQWTFAISGSPLPVKIIDGVETEVSSVTIDPTEGSSVTFDFGTFKFDTADMGGETTKIFTYTFTESGTVAGVTNDPDTDRVVKITVTDNLDGTMTVDVTPDSELVAYENTYNADGSTTLGGTKTLTGREFTEDDKWTFTIVADNGGPLPVKGEGDEATEVHSVTIEPTSGKSASIDFGTFKFDVDDLGGADEKTFSYTIIESGSVAGVTNDPDTDRVVKITVKDNHDGTLDVQMAADTEEVAYTNTYDASGVTFVEGVKYIENRKFQSGDSWTFTIEPKDDAPLPVGTDGKTITSVTINPTSGYAASIFYGLFKYQLADLDGDTTKTFEYTITESGSVAGVTNDSKAVRNLKITVTDLKNGKLQVDVADDSDSVDYTNTYNAEGEISLTGKKSITGRTFQSGDEWKFTVEPVDDAPLWLVGNDGLTTITINPTSGSESVLNFGTFKYMLSDLEGEDEKTFTYTITESGTVAGVTNDENVSRTIKINVSDKDKDGTLDCTLAADSQAAEWTNNYNASGEIDLTGTKEIEGRDFQTGDEWTFAISGSPLPVDADGNTIESVTINPTSGKSANIDFGTFKYKLSDLGGEDTKTFTYTITEGGTVGGVTNDENASRTIKILVSDEDKDGELDCSLVDDSDDAEWTNTYNADGSTTLGGTKTITGREFTENDEWTFTLAADNDGPLPVDEEGKEVTEVTINPTSGKSASFSFGTFKFDLDDLGGETEKTFTYTVTESGTVAGVTNDAKTTRTVKINVKDNKDGTMTVALADDSEPVAYTNNYDAAGENSFKGTKNIEGREFQRYDEWTFTIAAVDGAPLPVDDAGVELTSVTITPTSGEEAEIDLGTFKYTLADLDGETSKVFTYTITESGTVAGVINDTDNDRTLKIKVSDNKDGTLQVVIDEESDDIEWTNTYDAAGEVQIIGTKTLDGRDFKTGDEWTFTIAPVDGAPLPVDEDGTAISSVTIDPTEGSEADIDFGYFKYVLADLGGLSTKTFEYKITETGTVAGVTNDEKAERTLKIDVSDNGDGTLTVEVNAASDSVDYTNTYNANGDTTLGGTKAITGREFQEGDEWTFAITADNDGPLPVDEEGNEVTEVTINPTSGKSASFSFGTFKFDLDDLGGEDEKTFEYTITESGDVTGVTNDTDTDRKVKIHVKDNKDGTMTVTLADDSEPVTFTNNYNAEGQIGLTGKKTLEGRTFQTGDKWTFTISGTPLPVDDEGNQISSVEINPTSGSESVLNFGTFKYRLADLGGEDEKTFEYTITESGSVAGITNDEDAARTIKITVSDANKDGVLVCTLADDSQAAEWTNSYDAAGEIPVTGTKFIDNRNFQANDSWTFTIAPNGDAPLPVNSEGAAISSVSIRPTEGNAVDIDFGTFKYTLEDLDGKDEAVFEYTITEAGSVPGVTNDEDTDRVIIIHVKDMKDGSLEVTLDDVSDAIEWTNTYNADGSTTLGGTKTITGRNFTDGDSWTFEITANNGGPLPVDENGEEVDEVTIHPDGGSNTSFSFGTFKFSLDDLGGATTKTFQYTITESGEVDGVTNDPDTDRVVKITVTDTKDGDLDVAFTDDSEVIAFTNTYDAAGQNTFTGLKNIEGREFDTGDEWTFTIEAVDGAPLPVDANGKTLTSVTINPTEGETAEIALGTFKYTLADLGGESSKVFEYTITESGTVAGVTNDPTTTRTLRVHVSDNKDGTLSVELDENSDIISFTNTYDAEGSISITGTKEITGREFQENDSWTFTIAPTGDAPLPVNANGEIISSVTIRPTEGDSADIDFGTFKFTLEDLDGESTKAFEYTITETGSVPGVTNDTDTDRALKIWVYDDGDGVLGCMIDNENEAIAFTNNYNADGSTTLGGNKAITGRNFQEGDKWTFTLTTDEGNPLPVDDEGKTVTEATIEPTSGRSAAFNFGTIKFTLEDLDGEDEKIFEYTITESGTIAGVTNDTDTDRVVKIKVTDTKDGDLDVKLADGSEEVAFTNNYNAAGEIAVTGTKYLKGRAFLEGDKWTFTISGTPLPVDEDGNQISSVSIEPTSGFAATIDLGTFKYTLADLDGKDEKTFEYTITESGTVEGVTNDTDVDRVIKINVSDEDKDGVLDCTLDESGEDIIFRNSYDTSDSVSLGGTKEIVGRNFKQGDVFTFTITPDEGQEGVKDFTNSTVTLKYDDGDLVATSQTADFSFGSVTYALEDIAYELGYNVPKTYIYTVAEEVTDIEGITYDETTYPVTVTIDYDEMTGEMTVTADKTAADITFTNTYSTSDSTSVGATKKIEHRKFTDGDTFTFTITPEDGGNAFENPSVTLTYANGDLLSTSQTAAIDFGKVEFTLADITDENGNISEYNEFNYTVAETRGSIEGITYDETPHTVTIIVEYDVDTGKMAVYADTNARDIVFTNTYDTSTTVELGGSKTIAGRKFKQGDEFTFTITPDEGYEDFPFQYPKVTLSYDDGDLTADNKTASFSFGKIKEIPLEAMQDDGIFKDKLELKYTVVENASNPIEKITYDETVYHVTVTVTYDEATGKMEAAADPTTAGITFTNKYGTSDSVTLGGTKTIENRSFMQGDTFTFTITPTDGGKPFANPSVTLSYDDGDLVSDSKTADFSFGAVEYSLEDITDPETGVITYPQTFNYEVTEESGNIEGMTYDETVIPVAVTVDYDEATGDLTVSADKTAADIKFTNEYTTLIKVKKVDATNGEELDGAHIQIIQMVDGEEVIVDEWDSVAGEAHEVEGLKVETDYILRETVAPDGYTITSDTTFQMDEFGKIDRERTTTTCSEEGTLLVEDTKTKITVKKVDAVGGEELDGAHIQIIDKEGNVVDEWASKAGEAHEVEGLLVETEYTLRETVAPDGYTITTDTTFTIDKEGNIDKEKTTTTCSEEGTLLVEDTKTKITVNKIDAVGGEELDGAHIQIIRIDENGNEVIEDEWDSVAGRAHEVEGLLINTEYILRETVAPDGYTITSDTTFTIDETGKIDKERTTTTTSEEGTLLVEDTKTKITVKKVDATGGEELDGAHIQILDKEGNVVDEWDSVAGQPHEVEGLLVETEYTLRETVAPEGYTITTDTTFTIDKEGKIDKDKTTTTCDDTVEGTLLVEDTKTKITVQKVDAVGGEELDGAHIQIIKKDDEGNETIVEEWDSVAGQPHVIEGLLVNTEYTLRETVAPEGYTITTDTTFTIDEKGKIDKENTSTTTSEEGTLLVEDTKTKITVKKVDATGGEELDGAHIQIIKKDDEGNEIVVDEWDSEAGQPHEIEGLLVNTEYTLRETVAPEGYTITTDTTFVIDENGKIDKDRTTTTCDDTVEGTLLVEDTKTRITVQKVDAVGGEELDGAHIQIIDKDGNVVEEWDSEAGKPHVIEGLKVNEQYTLRETVAPEGYTITTDTTFTIDEHGKIDRDQTTTTCDTDDMLLVEDTKTKIRIRKVDVGTGEELSGAHIQLLDEEGNVVDEWVSEEGVAHEVEGLKVNTRYTIRETVAPDGYEITTDTTFEMDENGKIIPERTTTTISDDGDLLVEDTRRTANGEFQPTAKKILKGGTLKAGQFKFELKDSTGKVIQTKTNAADGTVTFDKITYTFADAGKTFNYSISEVNDHQAHLTYDRSVYKAEVKVVDQGTKVLGLEIIWTKDGKVVKVPEFINEYEQETTPSTESETPPGPHRTPKTGDDTPILPYAMLMFAAAALIAAITDRKRRAGRNN